MSSKSDGSAVCFLTMPDYEHYLDGVHSRLSSTGGVRPFTVAATQEQIELHDEEIRKSSLVVTVHSILPSIAQLRGTLKGKVKTLTIQDGVIEHRHSCLSNQGILRYRPVLTNRIAVFGPRSKGLVEAYGNDSRSVDVTGSPRFDVYFEKSTLRNENGPLLITGANRPAYSSDQIRSYYVVMGQLLRHCEMAGIPYRLRLGRQMRSGGLAAFDKASEELDSEIVKIFRQKAYSDTPLLDDLRDCRGVITTPSTVSLEAMAMKRPVAHLLYDAETVYLNTPWTIRNISDIPRVVDEVMNPPDMKMRYQNLVLEENLVCDNRSTERVTDLILSMMAGY